MKSDPQHRFFLNSKIGVFLQYAAFTLILFGIKLSLIHFSGNATPYWDQWDAEAANLYKPFVEGTLGWRELLTPHNEHYILITRFLALAELTINGLWNPLLQMVVNSVLHIGTIIFIITLLIRVIGRNHRTALLTFALVLFSVPYAWENTLAGIQSVFYFVLLFSTACLWFTVTHPPYSARWWYGIFFASLAFFSLASGIFALAAAAVVGLFLYFTGLRQTRQHITGIAIFGVLFLTGAAATPVLAHHAMLKAGSLLQFIDALKSILAWPAESGYLSAFIRNAPALIFTHFLLKSRPPANDQRWFILALIVWMFGTASSIAYGRADGNLASRYLDLYAVFILINFACLISLTAERIRLGHLWAITGTTLWIIAILVAMTLRGVDKLPNELEEKHRTGFFQEVNTRNYLRTEDASHLRNKPFLQTPYPDTNRLISLLSSPQIREILPANIRPPLTPLSIDIQLPRTFVTDGYAPQTLGRSLSVLGSYTPQGNTTTGKASMRLAGLSRPTAIAIPIAGFPYETGMNLAVEQNGKLSPITIFKDEKESWGIAYANVLAGAFTIHLTDANPEAWIAIDSPSITGKFDKLITSLLYNYHIFIFCGIAIAVLTAILQFHSRFKKIIPLERNS